LLPVGLAIVRWRIHSCWGEVHGQSHTCGRRGADKPLKREVLLVQQLLNRHRPPSLPRIAEDGGQGDETYGAIEEFQRRVMKLKKPDGRVDPGARPPGLNQPPAVVVTYAADPASRQPTGAMRMSAKARELLRKLESLFLSTYDDQTGKATHVVKGATIGYGHLIAKAEWDTYKAASSPRRGPTRCSTRICSPSRRR
jgi:hypothetical protein